MSNKTNSMSLSTTIFSDVPRMFVAFFHGDDDYYCSNKKVKRQIAISQIWTVRHISCNGCVKPNLIYMNLADAKGEEIC